MPIFKINFRENAGKALKAIGIPQREKKEPVEKLARRLQAEMTKQKQGYAPRCIKLIKALGESQNSTAVPVLVNAFKDYYLRESIIEAVAQHKNEQGARALLQLHDLSGMGYAEQKIADKIKTLSEPWAIPILGEAL